MQTLITTLSEVFTNGSVGPLDALAVAPVGRRSGFTNRTARANWARAAAALSDLVTALPYGSIALPRGHAAIPALQRAWRAWRGVGSPADADTDTDTDTGADASADMDMDDAGAAWVAKLIEHLVMADTMGRNYDDDFITPSGIAFPDNVEPSAESVLHGTGSADAASAALTRLETLSAALDAAASQPTLRWEMAGRDVAWLLRVLTLSGTRPEAELTRVRDAAFAAFLRACAINQRECILESPELHNITVMAAVELGTAAEPKASMTDLLRLLDALHYGLDAPTLYHTIVHAERLHMFLVAARRHAAVAPRLVSMAAWTLAALQTWAPSADDASSMALCELLWFLLQSSEQSPREDGADVDAEDGKVEKGSVDAEHGGVDGRDERGDGKGACVFDAEHAATCGVALACVINRHPGAAAEALAALALLRNQLDARARLVFDEAVFHHDAVPGVVAAVLHSPKNVVVATCGMELLSAWFRDVYCCCQGPVNRAFRAATAVLTHLHAEERPYGRLHVAAMRVLEQVGEFLLMDYSRRN